MKTLLHWFKAYIHYMKSVNSRVWPSFSCLCKTNCKAYLSSGCFSSPNLPDKSFFSMRPALSWFLQSWPCHFWAKSRLNWDSGKWSQTWERQRDFCLTVQHTCRSWPTSSPPRPPTRSVGDPGQPAGGAVPSPPVNNSKYVCTDLFI